MCGFSSTMDDIPIDKSKEKVSSSNRRNNKPLMEKRRRQRINDCLNQLKSLVLQAMNKDSTQYSKLEKADILEMTVKHLKLVQRQHMSAAMATDPHAISKYRAGYNECAAEVSRYLDTVNGGNPDLKGRLLGYLGNTMMQFPVIPVYQGMMSPYHVQQITSQMTSSQHGYQSQYNQDGSHHNPSTFTPAHSYSSQSSPPLDKSLHLEHTTATSMSSLHTAPTISPLSRRVPSPSDSDSGLSDRSSPMSHDENGNYSVFNINNQFTSGHVIKSEHSSHFVAPRIKTELVYSHPHTHNRSPKRKCDFTDDVSPLKRRHIGESRNPESVIRHVGPVPESDNMWRPW